MPTKSQEVANDVAALVRSRNPLLWIVTREEARVDFHGEHASGGTDHTGHRHGEQARSGADVGHRLAGAQLDGRDDVVDRVRLHQHTRPNSQITRVVAGPQHSRVARSTSRWSSFS